MITKKLSLFCSWLQKNSVYLQFDAEVVLADENLVQPCRQIFVSQKLLQRLKQKLTILNWQVNVIYHPIKHWRRWVKLLISVLELSSIRCYPVYLWLITETWDMAGCRISCFVVQCFLKQSPSVERLFMGYLAHCLYGHAPLLLKIKLSIVRPFHYYSRVMEYRQTLLWMAQNKKFRAIY